VTLKQVGKTLSAGILAALKGILNWAE